MKDKYGNTITPETLSAHWEEDHHNRLVAGMPTNFGTCAAQLRSVLIEAGYPEQAIKSFKWKCKQINEKGK